MQSNTEQLQKATEAADRWTETRTPVYHVGNLNAQRTQPRWSYEGGELSTSPTPEAWRQIAPDVNGETYELSKSDSTFYCVSNSSTRTDFEKQSVVTHNYVSYADGYKFSWTDAHDITRYTLYESRSELQTELDGRPVEQTYENNVKTVQIPILEASGVTYWNNSFTTPASTASPMQTRALIPIWTARHLPVDGVYWDHRLFVADYSAPRSLLFQESLPSWNCEVVSNTWD